jgi:thioredoxin 1
VVAAYAGREAMKDNDSMNTTYAQTEPSRVELDSMQGPVVVEFGTPWCGHSRAAQPLIAGAFASHADVTHLKIEDGSGKPLGRSFEVRLWPTLVFLLDGREVTRLVRPHSMDQIRQAMERIDAPAAAQ